MSTTLRERTLDTLKLGHYSERTTETYIDWLIRLSLHYNRSPADLSPEEIQAFMLHLIEKEKLAWSTVNQALEKGSANEFKKHPLDLLIYRH